MTKNDIWQQLEPLTIQFLKEIQSERAIANLAPKSSIERDLGIGSLERAELLHRIEKEFNVQLPESLMANATHIDDLIKAVKEAKPTQKTSKQKTIKALKASSIDPSNTKTLVETLKLYAETEPKRPHIYLQDEHGKEEILTYGNLFDSAKKMAEGLLTYGIKSQETIAIMLPTSKDFFFVFMGVLLAGAIPVPIYPPFRPDRIEEYVKREAFILRNASVRLLITFQKAERLSKVLKTFIPSLIAVTTTEDLIKQRKAKLKDIEIEGSDAALIQYTSGSTGDPKGVLLTHENLLANVSAYGKAIKVKPTDIAVSWLPLYHDMGLIGAWLGSFYHGLPLTIFPPLSFLARPERWLWAIHYHRATLSAAPNFAYELCLKKIDDEAIKGLDLSSWRLALNGAEAINPETLRRFTKRFSQYGLKSDVLFPVYGLAESTVALAFPPLNREPQIDQVAREKFDKEQIATPIKNDNEPYHEFVACGSALPKHKIRIVDKNNKKLPERIVGQIQFSGPSSMQGYYRRQDATLAIYHDGWWDTGDLGYMADGELFITGRQKDLIIKAGRNYYPEEIEETASLATAVRKGCVVAFGTYDEQTGTEKIIVVAEIRPNSKHSKEQIKTEILEHVTTQIGVPPDQVILVAAKTIPKTSSGKLRRSSVKLDYETGKIGKRGTPQWLQITKLFFSTLFKGISNFIKATAKRIYAAYVFIMLFLTVLPTWLVVLSYPKPIARKTTHYWAKIVLFLVGCPLRIKGKSILKKCKSKTIFIANHASYVDTVAMLATLDFDFALIGKKEFSKTFLFKDFVKKLGFVTVDRYDSSKSADDAKKIKDVLEQGRSIMIFPEGMLSETTGIRPFKLGAFQLAIETQTQILPIAIKGTRKIFRGKHFSAQPGKITVTFLDPIKPKSSEWKEAVRMRDLARIQIAKESGEQTLDLLDVRIKKPLS